MAGQVKKLSTEVAAQLRNEIIAGELESGSPLRLASVARRLGVSETPVREALIVLEGEGLVAGHLHRGFVVKRLSASDFEDAYALHAFVAARLTSAAVDNLNNREIAELAEIDRELVVCNRSGEKDRAGDLNHEFHRRIYLASGHSLLLRFLRETTPLVNRRYDPDVPGWADIRHDGHADIVSALLDRDAERAGTLMRDHILHAGELAVSLEARRGAGEADGHARASSA